MKIIIATPLIQAMGPVKHPAIQEAPEIAVNYS